MTGPRWTRLIRGARRRWLRRPQTLVIAIVVVGLGATGGAAWGVARVDRNTEERLLELQTRQATLVLSIAIEAIQRPLDAALSAQAATASSTDTSAFTDVMAASVGSDQPFMSASLWLETEDGFRPLASLGTPAALDADSPTLQRLLERAMSAPGSAVERVDVGSRTRIVYARADPASGIVVYAERAIPADRRAPVDNDSAYANLHYAIYFGPTTELDALATTDVDPSGLPLRGLTARQSVPFGDTELTLVTSPREHLGSGLSRRLTAIVLAGGLLLTAISAAVARWLVLSRLRAHGLFDQLQRSLLPQTLPEIAGLDIASRYVAGVPGVDIGGDWYSVVATEGDDFAFVVGDVSGRGLDAVAVMAHARFTLRAYLLDRDRPEIALEKCSHQFDISRDGHFATVLVGLGNARTGETRVASAGHPLPLLVSEKGAEYVPVPVGPPLGTAVTSYAATTFTLPEGASLIAFTDGLIERRTEGIDVGMARLADAAKDVHEASADGLARHVVESLATPDAADDIAVLVLKRVGR